jgi:PAS domain S-box-containing protein
MRQWFMQLVQPSDEVTEPADRHRARLIAAVLLFIVPVGMLAVIWGHLVEGSDLRVSATQFILLALMGAMIPLAKGPRFRTAVLGFIFIGMAMLCFAIVAVPEHATVNASYMVVPLIMASAFLGVVAATGFFFLNIALLVAMGVTVPELEGLLTPTVLTYQVIVGGILVMAGLYRDEVAREKQSDLTRREERHRALLAATFDGTAKIQDGVVVSVGDGFPEVFGIAEEDIIGKPLADLFPSDELESLALVQIERGGQLVEMRALRTDGREFPIEAVFQSQASLESAGVFLAIRDITERREVLARMQITDRMVAMGTLAAGVAHEINNPLTFVSGNLRRALKHLDGGGALNAKELKAWLESAAEGSERVGRIVGDLNTFARDPGDEGMAPLDVEKVSDLSVSIAFSAFKHKARLVREHEPRLVVLGDPTRLSQVLVNLLLNAAQALSGDDLEENEIRLSSYEEDGEVLIEVADNGSGIPAHILPRIFEPFYTTKPVGVGTGLGLSICKNLVERMGGVMEVETSSEGTVFRLRLHVAEDEVLSDPTAEAPLAITFDGRYRILVVDDEAEIGSLLQDILVEHDVEVCLDGQAALERLGSGGFDLVLCDLMMPKMTGMELYDACVLENRKLAERFIFLTGGAFTLNATAFLERVKQPRLTKPFSKDQIRKAVAAMMEA